MTKVKTTSNKKKLTYEVVLTTGKSARALTRSKAKRYDTKEIGPSTLGKMRSRQERKAMAKTLKVPFQPRYNAAVVNAGWKLVPTLKKDGTPTGYTKLILEAK